MLMDTRSKASHQKLGRGSETHRQGERGEAGRGAKGEEGWEGAGWEDGEGVETLKRVSAEAPSP